MKKETIKEAAKEYAEMHQDVSGDLGKYLVKAVFQDGAQWQQKRMYSKKDMEDSFVACWKANVSEGIECKLSFKEWFEQFKKK